MVAGANKRDKRNPKGWSAEHTGGGEWVLVWPPEVEDAFGEFDTACEHMYTGEVAKARNAFGRILKSAPTHIDAIHHLAIFLDRQGKKEEARELWNRAIEIGRGALPEKFKRGDRLEWIFLENRPFLRALHGLGCVLMADGKIDEALSIFEENISYNPNDNQGIRELLVELYFEKGKIDRVLALCEEYPGDALAGIIYGHSLALFKKGQRKKATEMLENSIKHLPRVAEELLKKKHKEPETDMPGYITHGGWDQAYEYWQCFGKYWDEEALEWLKEVAR